MKSLILAVFLFITIQSNAQKYVLLDQHMGRAPVYSDKVTMTDKFHSLLPVETKYLKEFINTLEAILKNLNDEKFNGQPRQYQIGCSHFTGISVPLQKQLRIDYVITSDCGDVKINMHLSDAKIANLNNYYFIKSWINYIRRGIKK